MPLGPTSQSVNVADRAAIREARNRRTKLAVMIVVFGPILLFTVFHLGRGVYKMANGEAIGYEQSDNRVGNAIE